MRISSFNWRRALPWLTTILVVAAGVLIVRVLSELSIEQISRSLDQLDAGRATAAALCVAGSYLTLTGFDWLGTRFAGKPLGYPRVALTSFTALSIGHTVGLAALSSGAVRYRFYTRWGLTAGDVARLVVSCAITVGLGQLCLASLALVLRPDFAAELLDVAPIVARGIGILGMCLIAGWIVAAALIRRPVHIARWSISLPRWPIAAAQVIIGTMNYAFIAAAMQRLLGPSLDYFTVATAYVLANLTALISHVPGGLGVIEAVMMRILPKEDVIGPLLAFRVLYYLAPLACGLVLFGVCELTLRARDRRHPAHRATGAATDSPG